MLSVFNREQPLRDCLQSTIYNTIKIICFIVFITQLKIIFSFLFQLWWNKRDGIYNYKTGQQAVQSSDPWTKGKSNGTLMIVPIYCVESVARPRCKEQSPTRVQSPTEFKKKRLEFEEAKAAKVCYLRYHGGGNCTEIEQSRTRAFS